MDDLKQQWAVTLEEKHDTFTVIGGQRGSGKIFFLENMVKLLEEQLKQEKIETERWKSAALYYADKLGSAQKLEVVLCKDCKHPKLPAVLTQKYGEPGTLTCHNWHSPCNKRNVKQDDFCSYGERKDNDRN